MSRRRPLLLETFEDRILCDAAPTLESPAAHEALLAVLSEQTATVTPAPAATHELVLVNDNVADRDLLIANLQLDAPGRVFEVRVLDSSRDGVAQVGALLEAGGSFDAVHVIGHADSAGFWLGGTRIDAQSLETLAVPLGEWQAHFAPGADFLLYGCDLAVTAEGQALANRLGVLTGTDVAASTDTTGSAVLGGDWQLEFQAGNITSTLPAAPDAWRHTLAGDLQVEVFAAPNFVVDSNLGASPQAATLIAKITNTGANALTDVFLNMGNFAAGTPGVYQTTTWPGLTGTFSLTHEGGTSDATRYLGTIQPGETKVQYWLVSYPLTDANGDAVFGGQADPSDDLVLQYDVWATANDGGTPLTTNQANTVALRSEISAMANKVWPNTTSKVPDDYLQIFDEQLGWRPVTPDPEQAALLQGVWYDLGRVNQGYDADANLVPDYDAFLQPVGDPGTFDANANRLVSSYGVLIVKLNDGTEQVTAFRDTLYFKDIPANNTGVVGLVFYQFAQIGQGSSQLSPYQEAASGSNNEKFNGDYGTFGGNVIVSAALPAFDKTVSLAAATPGTTVTYTLTTTAAPTSGYGLPLNGLPMVMQDSIPTGTTYVAGSAQAVAVPGGTVAILYSTNGGTSWTTTEPAAASVTNIQWWFSDKLAASQVASVSFQTTINVAFTGQLVVNDAGVGLGNNPPTITDEEVTYVLGSRTISGLVFRDEGTGGGTASDGVRNGTEGGLQSIDVSLYLDLNANGVIDSTDVLRATTLSVAGTGAWSFSSLTNGSYIVKVDRGDADRPAGWTLSTTDLRTAVINNADVTALEFGYAPILDVEKNLVGGSPVFEGDLVSYTIDVTNLLGGHGGSTLPVSQDIWLSTNGASTFTNPTSALSVPDGNVATGASNQVLIGTNPLGFVAQNSVVGVMALIKVQLSGALTNDTLDIGVVRNGVSVGTVTLTAAQLNGFIASAGTIAVDVSGLAQWTAADFTSATTGLTVNYTRVGANDAITASIDAYGYRVSTGAVDPSAGSLYYSDATDNSIARALPNGANRTAVLTALGDDPNDIAYDPVAEKIYWSVTTGGFIRRANLDGTNVETIVTGGGTITGLDIDAVNRTLWWSDIAGDRIVRANLDGTGQTVVLSALSDPQAIAVDAAGGKIYWGESQGNTMKRANLDGTGTQTILSKAIFGASFNFPEDIELDAVGGKIYWTDSAAGGFVGRANLDGTGSQTLLSGGSPLGLGLDVAAGQLYYSTGTAVVRANLDGSSQQTVFSGLGTGREVEVFGSSTVTNTSTFDINSTLAFVPLTDTYDPAKLQYVSSSLTPSSVAGGTITWANIGPINGGVTDRITVTFRALEPAGNVATTVTNTAASSGSLLANGQVANTDTDFVTAAMQPTANIGDVIWNDGNSNGVREANEGGISGVQFQLLNSAAQVIATTTSDSAGAYLFTGVRDGTYTVRVVAGTLPAGMVQSFDADGVGTANQSTLTIASAANNLAQDFGYGGRFLLSGTVWRDYDRDGVLDSVETALTGATVALTVGGVSQGSSTLDATGGYRFSIPTATAAAGAAYVLTVTTPAGTWTQTADPNGAPLTNPFSSNLGNPLTSNTLANQDFAFYQTGTSTIGDTLFFDWNQNGTQDATDEGIPNITVTLFADLDADGTLDATDAPMLTTTTNASGVYSFTNLPAGSFIVLPDTNDADFPTNTTPTLTVPHALTLAAATTNNAVDFGFYKAGTGTIGGTVWTDRNGDQLQAGGAELGLAGVTVTLQADLNNDGVFVEIATATTSATGTYSFASLPFAAYRVVVSATDAALPLDDFNVRYSATTVLTRDVTLSSGTPGGTADYGFTQLGSVGDTVFYDANRNATQDYNETGIAGVQVRLLNSASAVVATVTTDADGHYRFTGLTPDTYTAEVLTATLPAGVTAANLTGDPDRDGVPTWDNTYPGLPAGDHRDSGIVVSYGSTYSGADFGYEPPAVVGDFIFRDLNANGVQDSSELGIANVTVTLTQGATVHTTASDPDGFYFFQFVGAGDWTVAVTQPAGYVVTGGINADLLAGTGSVGANSATLTMDAAGVLTQINGTALTGGNQKIDFGYRFNGTNNLSGTVVLEQQGATDGNSGEATDTAVSGVTIFLLDGANTVLGSALTNAAGQYSFANLPNGAFRVSMTANVSMLQYTQLTTVTGNTPATAVVNNGTSAYQTLNLAGSASGADFAWVTTVDYDFGDLPDSYGTTLAADGARHILSGAPTLYLGTVAPDTEADGVPGALASSDGADEDGISVVNPAAWFEGANGGTIRAVVQGTGWLVGWLDFDGDGSFLDSGEMVVNQAVTTGTQDFTFDVPAGALNGGAGADLYARFRLFTDAPPIPALASVGAVTGGEVEDYRLHIGPPLPALAVSDVTVTEGVDGFAEFTVSLDTASAEDITFDLALANGSATGTGTDYGTAGAGNLQVFTGGVWVDAGSATIAAGDTSVLVRTPIAEDALPEATEIFALTATVTAGSTGNPDATGTGTILDFDATLSGFVYVDANNDGVFGGGESAISGVTVTLTGTDDLGAAVNVSTVTDASGAYSFTNLRPSNGAGYTLTETPLAGFLDGRETVGTQASGTVDNTTDSDTISGIVLAANVTGAGNNFADLRPAALAGAVFSDANNDGLINGSDSGIAGATVTLTGTNDRGAAVNTAAITDAAGAYAFVTLRPGTYTLTETQAAGFLDGTDTIGTPGGATANDVFSGIALTEGTNGAANNFAELAPASLAGSVYLDANNDGVQQGGETGIAGVTVTLTGNNDLGAVNVTTTTDANGAYTFANLRPSDATGYTLTETQAAGYGDGTDAIGTQGGTAGNDVLSGIVLGVGAGGTGNNFGERIEADLSITKTDGSATYTPGTAVSYTVVVSNGGPSFVSGAVVADTIPANISGATWTAVYAGVGSAGAASGSGDINEAINLASGGSATFTITGTALSTATGNLVNTATVTAPADVTDPTPGNNSATDTDTANPVADLSITKTDGSATYTAGTAISYTVVVSNTGPSFVTGAVVADTIPANISGAAWTAVYAGVGSAGAASGSGDINEAINLASGGSATFTITGTVLATATGNLVNTATVAAPAGVTDSDPGNNSATDTDTANPVADLSITKTDGVASVVPGTATTYTIVVSNTGPSFVTGATVADTLPAALTGVSWTAVYAGAGSAGAAGGVGNISTVIDLAVGGSATFTVTGTVAETATGNLVNTATVTPPVGVTDPTPGDNSATDTDALTPVADLAITKTDGSATYIPGTAISYTVVVSNTGPSFVTGAVVADTIPANISGAAWTAVYAGAGSAGAAGGAGDINEAINLASGGSATFTITGTVLATATGNLVNTATVAAPAGVTDSDPGNNSATDTDTANPVADLSITKTDGVASVVPGTATTYTIVVSNTGPSFVTGATVADTLPATLTGVNWTAVYAGAGSSGAAAGVGNISTVIDLASGGSATFTVTGTVVETAVGNLVNTATVTPPVGVTDPTPGDNSATDTDTLTPVADLAITKTDGSATYTAGTAISYTVVVSNTGPSFVTGAVVADTIPANISGAAWTAVYVGAGSAGAAGGSGDINEAINLASGGSATFTITGTVLATATGNLVNTATVAAPAGVTDSDPGNNSATDTDTANPVADLSITKTDGVASVVPGTATTYTIVVSNSGPSFVTGATVADTLPAALTGVSWTAVYAGAGSAGAAGGVGNISTVIDLAVGGSATFTVTGTVAETATGNLVNTATAAPPVGVTDPTPGDNSATDTDTLTPVADLSVTKTDGSATYISGTAISYTVVVSNSGPSFVTGALVADTIPANISGATWTAVYAGAGSGGAAGGIGDISTTIDLASGGSATFTISGTVLLSATGDLVNTATVTAPVGVTDPTPGNDSATDTDARDLTSLAGFVFSDANNDGIVQPGESGIVGATVTLTGTDNLGGAVNVTATTLANGSYSFVNLRPSDAAGYTITGTQPVGFLDGTDIIGTPGGVAGNDVFGTIILAQGVIGADNNFGELAPSSLSGSVYNDTNNDGIAQVGESGIAGVTVTLTGTDDLGAIAPIATTTLADGSYTFGSLRPGTYAITQTQPGAFLDGADTIGTPGGATGADAFTGILLATGTDGMANNFGELRPATLSGTVFQDDSNDGTQQPGEPGVANATVTLTGTDDLGAPVSVTGTTLADGSYSFGNLRPGTYALTETQPAGLLDGIDALGTAGGALANDAASAIVIVEGQTGSGYTFGELAASSFSGTVFSDLDNNGAINGGESGIGGATVTLTGTDDLGAAVSLSTSSAVDGTYGFGNLRPGTYALTETQPAGLLDGRNTAGTAGGTTVNNPLSDVISAITLPSNTAATGYLFGELAPASFSGTVFHDLNNDGVNDPTDLPIAGATVTLTGTDDLGGAVNTGAISAADGTYIFANLRPGTYTLTETQPASHLDGTDTAGTAGGTPANDSFSAIALAVGQTGGGYLFGERTAPDLVVTKTDGIAIAHPGELLTYTITVANASLQQADSVTVTDQFPSSLEFVSADNGGVLDPGTGVITWSVGAIAGSNAQTVTLTVIARVPSTLPASLRSVANTATALDISGLDADPTDNTASDTDSIPAPPDLYILKTDGLATAQVGQQTTYAITGGNAGGQTAQGVVITDTLPAGLRFVSASNGGQLTGGQVVWNLGDLAPGATFQLTVRVVVESAASGRTVVNTVTIADRFGSFEDATPLNNSATDPTRIAVANVFAFDSFNNFASRDQRPGLLPHLASIDVSRDALLPLAPIYSGEADPGSTLVVTLYNAKGEHIGSQTVVVDAGGNWLASFPSTTVRDVPQSVRITQLSAPYSLGDNAGHNLRTYFSPALNPGHFFLQTTGTGLGNEEAPLLNGLGLENPLQLGSVKYGGELLSTQATASGY